MRYLISLLGLCAACSGGTTIGTATVETLQVGMAAGGGGLSKTSLVAWYDFDDATDAHGTYDLTEVNTPTYTSGYGTAAATGNKLWTQNTVDGVWAPNSSTDATLVIRIRPYTGIVNGDYAFLDTSNGFQVRHITTTGARIRLAQASDIQTTTVMSAGTWYLFVVEFDYATTDHTCWVNDGSGTTVSAAFTAATVGFNIGGPNATTGENFDIDYIGMFNRKLTSDERTWLYNSGGTRTYAELD